MALADLPLALSVYDATFVAYFNRIARPADVAMINPSYRSLTPTIATGMRCPYLTSFADAPSVVPAWLGLAALLGYDCEHWTLTPTAEQSNLVATVAAASALAHQHHLGFLLVPDARFDQQYAAALARFADIYVLQAQAYQGMPTGAGSFQQFVTTQSNLIRAQNGGVRVFAQVDVSGALPAYSTIYASLQAANTFPGPGLDGISVFVGQGYLSNLETFVDGYLRSGGWT
jgi:hypothetical protein